MPTWKDLPNFSSSSGSRRLATLIDNAKDGQVGDERAARQKDIAIRRMLDRIHPPSNDVLEDWQSRSDLHESLAAATAALNQASESVRRLRGGSDAMKDALAQLLPEVERLRLRCRKLLRQTIRRLSPPTPSTRPTWLAPPQEILDDPEFRPILSAPLRQTLECVDSLISLRTAVFPNVKARVVPGEDGAFSVEWDDGELWIAAKPLSKWPACNLVVSSPKSKRTKWYFFAHDLVDDLAKNLEDAGAERS